MSKRIVVTGSGAVLGSAMKKISLEYKNYKFIFMNSKDCDLRNFDDTLSFFSKVKATHIIHLAAVSGGIGLSMDHHGSMLRDNILMTFSVLEAARKLNVEKVILTLTTGMYPESAPLPLNEDNIHDGEPHHTNYGSSYAKRINEPAIRGYRSEYGLNVIGLIPSGIFGVNDNFSDDAPMLPSVIRRFYENKDTKDNIVVWGDGSPLREYTYSEDMARAYMWALEEYNDEQVLNVGTTEENSIKEIAHMISDIFSIDSSRLEFDTLKPAGIHRKNTDNSRFIELSNFRYTKFIDGLTNVCLWYSDMAKNNPEAIRLYGKNKG